MTSSIEDNAMRLRELNMAIQRTFREHPHGPQHHAACDAFHRQYDTLAFPSGLDEGMARLAVQDKDVVETAIQFLEADPRFHRSGYIKIKLLRRLKHCKLSADQKRRMIRLIARSLDGGGQQEFRAYSKLAPAVFSPQLINAVHARLASRPVPARRAADILHLLKSQGIIVQD